MYRDIEINPSDIQRFWNYVDVKSEEDCWPWQGGHFSNGYGSFAANHTAYIASRVSWVIHNGPITRNEMVRHKVCRNPTCVNPNHLAKGSARDNTWDAIKDGTHATVGSRRFDEETIRSILLDPREQKVIAQEHNTSSGFISSLKSGERWAHLQAPIVKRPRGRKLTEDDVRAIRSDCRSNSAVAREYGVSQPVVCNIRKRTTWANVV